MRFFQKTLIGCLLASFNAQADESLVYQLPFGFELEQSTLSDVRERFGGSDEFDIPYSHHEFGICYTSVDSDEVVVFLSGHEFGGTDKKLLGVTIIAKNNQHHPCSASTLSSSDLTIGELRLGLTKEQFEALSSADLLSSEDDIYYYNLEYRRGLNAEEKKVFELQGFGDATPEEIDVGLGIWSNFSEGHATEVGVWQISTY